MLKSALTVIAVASLAALIWWSSTIGPKAGGLGKNANGGLESTDSVGQRGASDLADVRLGLADPGSLEAASALEAAGVEEWLPKRPYEQIVGLKASNLWADFLGPDYQRLAPSLERILKRSDPLGLEAILNFPVNEKIGDPADCLVDIKPVWLGEMQANNGYVPYPYLMQIPGCLPGLRNGTKLLESLVGLRRFNPDLSPKNRSSAEYGALRAELDQELGLLTSMVADLISVERRFVEADLERADQQHPPLHGKILFCPVIGIPEPLVTGDYVNPPDWHWFCYLGGVGSATTRCGLLTATYTLDLRGHPEIRSLVEGVIAFKEDLAHRMSLRVPLLPSL
jgi:hypothetical protein